MSIQRFLDYDLSVFINCPFDAGYQELFEAMVFAVHECGFVARSARESRDASKVRIEKIFEITSECRYGIHDISRTELDAISQLPRFNMPLELGMFLGAKYYGNENQREKVCLVLDREKHRYQKFCSDIAGQDIDAHTGDIQKAVTSVRDFLQSAPVRPEYIPTGLITLPNGVVISYRGKRLIPSGSKVFERYRSFLADAPALCASLSFERQELTFSDYVILCEVWLKVHPHRSASLPEA